MEALYIDLNNDSPAFINCLKAVNKENDLLEKELLEKVMHVCASNNKKHIFIWYDMTQAISYLEDVRKRNMFCWFYLIFNIIDKTIDDYDIKLLIKNELMPSASKAMELYKKRFPRIESTYYD